MSPRCQWVNTLWPIDRGKRWLRKWLAARRHQNIAWTTVELSAKLYCGIHIKFHEKCSWNKSVTVLGDYTLKSYLILSYLPGANEFNGYLRWCCIRCCIDIAGITLRMGSSHERRRYNLTSSLIGWAHAQSDVCTASCHNENPLCLQCLPS